MVEDPEKRESESQAIEGYACDCGEIITDLNEFRKHLFSKGHKSRGRINLETGEITMPPAKERTPEQWKEAKYGRKTEKRNPTPKEAIKQTETLGAAMQIKFVPRIYTVDYSPLIRSAQSAATNIWGWPSEMGLGDFLDTCIWLLFKKCGIKLISYEIEETEEERNERIAKIATLKQKEEVQSGSTT